MSTLPSNECFYTLAGNTCAVTPFLVFGAFNLFFPGSGGMISISLLGLVAAFALHFYRLRVYRYTLRRVKSSNPIIFFVFIWFCTVSLVDEWRFENVYITFGIMLCYIVSTSLFLYRSWLNNLNDRLIVLWFLVANWFLSACFVFPAHNFLHTILMIMPALASYWLMALLQKRVREGTYWRHDTGTPGAECDDSLVLCCLPLASLSWAGIVMFLAVCLDNGREPFAAIMPGSTAFHFVVSWFLASEFVLYVLKECGLLKFYDEIGEK